MQSVNFNVVRSSDREIIDAIKSMVANGKGEVAPQTINFSFLSDGDFQIAAGDLDSNEKLNAIISDNVRVFRSIRIDSPLGIISIQRHGQPSHQDNTQPYDPVSVGPRQPPPKPEDFARLVGFAQQHLGRFSVNALESYLGEDAKRHFEAREIALARLEQLVAKLTYDLEDARKAKDEEFAAKDQRLEQKFLQQEAVLESKTQQLEAAVEQRKQELDQRETSLNLQAAKAERRQVRLDLKNRLEQWSQNFEITAKTKRLRLIMHVLCVALLALFGAAAGIYLYQSLEKLDTPQLIAVHTKQAVFAALFVATSIFYVKWNSQWFHQRANEEFRLKRIELDFDRASWVVELMFQWKDEHKEDPLPADLIDRLTGHLFVADKEDQPPTHPYETLGAMLLGASAKVKLAPTGPEVELDRKGLRQFQKESS